MNAEIKEFNESGKLEAFVLGQLPEQEARAVRSMIDQHAEVDTVYQQLQMELERMVQAVGRPAPQGLKDSIMGAISEESVPGAPSSAGSKTPWLCIAAGIAALLLGGFAFYQHLEMQSLSAEIALANSEVDRLEAEYASQSTLMVTLKEQLDLVNDPATQRIILQGNDQAPQFETVTYWNPEQRTSLLDITQLPPLSNDECYQMWADVDGEMISLGVIPADADQMLTWTFLENAESLNVTIEPQGGSEHPTVSRLVASQAI